MIQKIYSWSVLLACNISFVFSSELFCQVLDPLYRNYSIQDGLPSSEVYMVYQDSKGYIWFATDNGVCRFNGSSFKSYNVRDGLTDNVVFKIIEDRDGKIWFGTHSCMLSYFFNDTIYTFKYNYLLSDALPKNPILNSFQVDTNNNIYLGLISNGYYKISPEGNIEHFNPDRMTYQGFGTYYVMEMDSKLFGYVSADIPWSTKERIIFPKEGKELNKTFQQDKILVTRSNFCILKTSENHKFLSVSRSLIIVDSAYNETFVSLNKEILNIYENKEKEIMFGFYKGGIGYFNKTKEHFSFLKKLSVSSIIQDHEGGYWFSTLEKGVYYVPDLTVISFSPEPLISNSVANVFCKDPEGNIFVGWQDGSICLLSKNDYTIKSHTKIGPENIACQIFDLIYQAPSKLWVGTVGDIITTTYQKKRIDNIEVIPIPCPDLAPMAQYTMGGNAIGICRFDDQKLIYNSALYHPKIRVNCLVADSPNTWIGSKNGLWIFKNDSFYYEGKKNPLLRHTINDIKKTKSGIFCATEGIGIVIFKNDTILNLSHNDGLINDNINSIYIENDSSFLLATQDGVVLLKMVGNEKYITNLSEKFGLNRQETSEVISNENDLLIAEKNGLRIIKNFNNAQNVYLIPMFITGIKINNLDTILIRDYDLTHDMNSIGINFIAISYKYQNALKYNYRMLGLDSTWQTTAHQSVNYAALPPGSYQFEVTVAGLPELKHQTATINFSISPPFWSTWWFISAVSIFIISLVSLVIYFRIRQIVNRGKLLQALNESQHKALSAQMNPHFIFNSLNSIHTYILQNKTDDSSKYLAKFAKLMRMVLDNSRENLITLKEELKALEFYLELEVMRFKGKISYSIYVDEVIDANEMKIPPLLLQPYVENAIWHGLMHKMENGFIEIRLSKKENEIICSITDDGIGRAKSADIKKATNEDRKSAGMNITDQRISLIKSVHNINIGTSVNDRLNKDGTPNGTEVIIHLPVLT